MIRISYHAVIVVSSIKSNSRRKCTQTIPTSRPKPRRFDTQSYYLRGRPGIITYSLSWNGDSTRPPLSHRLRSNVIIEKNNSSTFLSIFFPRKKLNKPICLILVASKSRYPQEIDDRMVGGKKSFLFFSQNFVDDPHRRKGLHTV